jgi:hypothetical protein
MALIAFTGPQMVVQLCKTLCCASKQVTRADCFEISY